HSPAIAQSAKLRQTLFAKRTRGHEVPFFTSHVALVIQRPGNSGTIPHLTEDGETFIVQRGRALIFALQLEHAGEIAEGSGDVDRLSKVLPDCDTALEE